MNIVHIISKEKFTEGYIDFMNGEMQDYKHFFIITEGQYDVKLDDKKNCIDLKKNILLIKNKKIRIYLDRADKIIVSGFFKIKYYIHFLPIRIQKKMYIQFWGGDFYSYKNIGINIKKIYGKYVTQTCVNKSAGIINLIEGDYAEWRTVFAYDGQHFIAPVPASPKKNIDYSMYKSKYNDDKIRLVVGNSATESNHHVESFDMIRKFVDERFIIYCPLSYGNSSYREKIIRKGKEYFGDNFIAVVDYMEKEEYIQFLANCNVGIFNNDRQQAMGNIAYLIRLGKTVYIRDDTSMWENYTSKGIIIRNINDLTKRGFALLNKKEIENNLKNFDVEKTKKRAIEQWKLVLRENDGK